MSTEEQRGVVFPRRRRAPQHRRGRPGGGRGRAPAGRPGRRAGRRAGDQLALRLPRRTSAGWSRPGCTRRGGGGGSPTDGLASLHDRMRVRRRTPDADVATLRGPAAGRRAAARPRCRAARSRSGSCPCRTTGSRLRGDDAAPPARRLGAPPGWSSRPPPRRSGTVHGHPEWLRLTGAPWRCSAPAPRWGRCRRCCAGAPGWPRSTCPGRAAVAAGAGHRPARRRALRAAGAARHGGPRTRPCRGRPARRRARRGRLARRARRPAGARQLRLRRRGHQRAGLDGRRRADPRLRAAAATTSRWRSWPRRPTCSRCPATAVAQRDRGLRGPLDRAPRCCGRPLRALSAGPAAAPRLRPGRRPRASTTAWCRSRGRTTRWPSGSSAGGPRSPATPAAPCR